MLALMAFSSCKKSLSSRLEGTWVTTKENYSVTQKVSGAPDQTSTVNTSGGNKFIFKSDGTGSWSGTDSNGQTTTQSFTWTAGDNTVTCTGSDGTVIYTVLTNEKTKQQWSFDYSQNISMGGISIVQAFKGTYDLSKL